MGDPATTGIRVMSRQIMAHYRDPHTGRVREHFGFIDGISQPRLRSDRPAPTDVPLGEFVLGYENDRGDMPFHKGDNARAVPGRTRGSWLDNGSFLVVRKLEQDVDEFHKVIATIGDEIAKSGLQVSKEDVLAKLMGRTQDGQPVTPPFTTQVAPVSRALRDLPNEFTYEHDEGLAVHCMRISVAPTRARNPFPASRDAEWPYGPRWCRRRSTRNQSAA